MFGQREVGAMPARRPFWARSTEVLESRASSLSSVQIFSLAVKVPAGAVMRWTMTRGTMAVGVEVLLLVRVVLARSVVVSWPSAIRHLSMSSQAFQHWQPVRAVSRSAAMVRRVSL